MSFVNIDEEVLMAPLQRSRVSDTVTVTSDGRTIVDVRKLLGKRHIQDAIRKMRAKTVIVARKSNLRRSGV